MERSRRAREKRAGRTVPRPQVAALCREVKGGQRGVDRVCSVAWWGQPGGHCENLFGSRRGCCSGRRGARCRYIGVPQVPALVKWQKESIAITFGAEFHRRRRKSPLVLGLALTQLKALSCALVFSGGWMDDIPSQAHPSKPACLSFVAGQDMSRAPEQLPL